MKLYATTTSERATKGQGGNEFVSVKLTAGEGDDIQTMLEATLEAKDYETETVYTLWNSDILVDTLVIPKSKGKRQKGDNVCVHCGKSKPEDWNGYCNECEL